MDRKTAFTEYVTKNNGITLIGSNIRPIYENLALAGKNNCLVEFLLNEKPYKSRFAFVANYQARGCDQLALTCALNLFGAENPGFAKRLNNAFIIASNKSLNQAH